MMLSPNGQREGKDKKHGRAGDPRETGRTRRAVVFRGDDRFRALRGGIGFKRLGITCVRNNFLGGTVGIESNDDVFRQTEQFRLVEFLRHPSKR